MKTPHRIACAAALLWLAGAAGAAGYTPKGTCAGLPRIDVHTPPGYCVALVADASQGLRFPRRILEVAPGRYWLIDMGSWEPRRGRLLELLLQPGQTPRVNVLADKLDRPLGLARGPDGRIYVGEAGRIWRTPVAADIKPETVIDGLPSDGAHPLKEIVFGNNGRLFINVGSSTDACRDNDGKQAVPCAEGEGERPRAAVYEAVLGGPNHNLQSLRPYATGLRNSVALAFVPGPDVLLQGENSIDYPDEREPAEELNLLLAGKHYGWPYCVGAQQVARGYEGRFDCKRSTPPAMSWPAHAAPLQMLAIPASSASPFAGQLLVAWHGHRPTGQRVVAFKLDAKGLPAGPARPWIDGWAARDGVRPKGAPTGLLVDSAGRLWVVEDRNRSVLMLVRETP